MAAPPPEELASLKAAGDVPVQLWRWPDTGFSVALARAPGPITHAFFAIATEAHDDDGLPHTLEHLVFLGSELYPYKGVLDMAANRLFARGTNAWTATDHTAYTATHAGAEGLLALLPVYADHVLFPTLTESGYLTEVHHVNGEGADAGVVYCEMQARENSGYSRSAHALDRLLFPFPACGYAAETGGRLRELRESCSHAKVVAYHAAMYRPSGVRLLVAGDVEPAALLAALEPVQARIRAKGFTHWPPAPARPWAAPAPPLAAPVNASIQFPSDDEATGIVRVAWLTFPFADAYRRSALEVLLTYLSDTSVSELQRAFVECEPPLAGGVYARTEDYNPGVATLTFDSVPTPQLGRVTATLSKVLSDFGASTSALDAPRLASVLHRRRLETLDAAESSPGDALAAAAIPAFLYAPPGADGDALREALDTLARLDKLEKEPAAFWTRLAQEALVDAPRADVVAAPSAALGRDMAAAEAARLAAQKEALGADKLAALGEALDAANAANNVPMPDDALRSFPVPPVDGVRMHAVATLRSDAAPRDGREAPLPPPPAQLAAFAAEVAALPLPAQFDDVASAFVDVTLLLRTDTLSPAQRALLPTFLALTFESPVRRGDLVVPHDDIVAELSAATLGTHATLGMGGGRFSVGSFGAGAVVIGARAEAAKYGDAARLLCECVLRGVASAERVRVQAAKALNAVPRATRDGGACASALLRRRTGAPGATPRAVAFAAQQRAQQRLLARLDTEPDAVCAEFEALRAALLAPAGGVTLHVAGRLAHLAAATSAGGLTAPWAAHLLPALPKQQHSPPLPGRVTTNAAALAPPPQQRGWAAVLANSAVESGFLSASAPGPAGWHDAQLAPLMVASELLTQLEGPFWKRIRGLGLAYSYSLSAFPEEGLVYFTLFKAAHVAKAYAAAAAIVAEYAAADATSSPLFGGGAVETAVSSAIFGVLNREATPGAAGSQALVSYLRSTGAGHNARLVAALRAVSAADVAAALRRYVVPLFDGGASCAASCVNPNAVDALVADFKAAHGITFVPFASLEAAFPEEDDVAPADVAGVTPVTEAPCVAGGRVDSAGEPQEGCACPKCVRNTTKGPFSLA